MFSSYEDAMSECCGFGYEGSALVETVMQKTIAYRDSLSKEPVKSAASISDLALLLSLEWLRAERSSGPVNVLDFGGACGGHYFFASSVWARRSFKWHVVETEAMAARAQALSTEQLSFFDTIRDATSTLGTVDLLHCSGVFQYVPDPYVVLKVLLATKPRLFVFSRLALTTGDREVVVVHESRLGDNGPGPMPAGIEDQTCRYPCQLIRKDILDGIIEEAGYRAIISAPDPSAFVQVNDVPASGCLYIGGPLG